MLGLSPIRSLITALLTSLSFLFFAGFALAQKATDSAAPKAAADSKVAGKLAEPANTEPTVDVATEAGVACLQAFEDAEATGAARRAWRAGGRDESSRAKLAEAEQRAADSKRTAQKSLQAARDNGAGWPSCSEALPDICAQAARGELAGNERVLRHIRSCVTYRMAGVTAGAADVGSEALRSVAQVVVTKAQAAGWGLLLDRLKQGAECAASDTAFPKACGILATLSIKDLVSSPSVLVDAVIQDLLMEIRAPVLKDMLSQSGTVAGLAMLDLTQRWAQSGSQSLRGAMRQVVFDYARNNAAATCEALTTPEKYGYVLGMCLAQAEPGKLEKCPVTPLIRECSDDADTGAELKRLWDLTVTALAPGAQPIDGVNLVFALGRDQLEVSAQGKSPAWKATAEAYFAGTKDLASGLAKKDWVMAAAGAVAILKELEKSTGADASECDTQDSNPQSARRCSTAKRYADGADLFFVLAAVGNYALTFDKTQNPDPKAAGATREQIITELVDRMVNRTDRTTGMVVSLGGTLGMYCGGRFARTDKWRKEIAFPVQLTLGVGAQTYSKRNGGLHLMFSAIDLGQYVNWDSSGDLKVASADLKSAVSLGGAIGGWFALRETPLHLAVQGSIAPFNRADGKATYQAGVVLGIYVPLLDFN